MKFTPLDIDGVFLIEPDLREDERGFFTRSFCEQEFAKAGLWHHFPQHNISFNKKAGTLRGMHYQIAPHEELKIVRCAMGSIYDVVVDIRPGSKDFGKWSAVELSGRNNLALYVPAGLAHGFQTLEDNSSVYYLMGTSFEPGHDAGFRWNDPAFGIDWPRSVELISDRDKSYPDFVLSG